MLRKVALALILIFLAATALFLYLPGIFLSNFLSLRLLASPEQALDDFYFSTDLAEDQLTYPLIMAGPKVIPALVKNVANKEMPKRRYAIQALGNFRDRRAISILVKILNDEEELDHYRCDALGAIAVIDQGLARRLAKKYVNRDIAYADEMSGDILAGRYNEKWLFERSLVDALQFRHD